MTDPTADEPVAPGLRRRTSFFSSVRVRMLSSFVFLLALAALGSVAVERAVLIQRLDERIQADLRQEVSELRRLAGGNDPETGEPFGARVDRIFEVFLERNIPSRNEAQITFIDGEPFLRSRRAAPYPLDRDEELMSRWGRLRTTDRGRVDSPAGDVEYMAVPIQLEGRTEGVFVVAIFRDLERSQVAPAVVGAAAVGGVVLVLGTLLAWRLSGKILRPVAQVRDTARRISESDLRRRIDVDERDEVGQLAATFNDMLDRLEKAFAVQRQFIDDAGHELRTPITIIRGQLETLSADPAEREKAMEIVMDELDRVSRFVSDLVLLARADQPDFLDLRTVDVGVLTGELHTKASALAPRDWRLESTGRGRIVADRQRLTQAIMQLAENAAKHTNEGDPITLGSHVADGEARLWVRDSGPGIDEAEQSQIFERLWRRQRASRADGAGLGLSIVRAIATAHHGRIELKSSPGEGATFTLVVPVEEPPQIAEGPAP